MYDDNKIVKERQRAIRRRIDERGILPKTIAADGGWENTSTVLSYFPANQDVEPAMMSVAALHRLIRTNAIPIELLSDLLPTGFAIFRVPEGIDHDQVCEDMQDYLQEKARSHHPESPGGREIAECEDNVLRGKFAKVSVA